MAGSQQQHCKSGFESSGQCFFDQRSYSVGRIAKLLQVVKSNIDWNYSQFKFYFFLIVSLVEIVFLYHYRFFLNDFSFSWIRHLDRERVFLSELFFLGWVRVFLFSYFFFLLFLILENNSLDSKLTFTLQNYWAFVHLVSWTQPLDIKFYCVFTRFNGFCIELKLKHKVCFFVKKF